MKDRINIPRYTLISFNDYGPAINLNVKLEVRDCTVFVFVFVFVFIFVFAEGFLDLCGRITRVKSNESGMIKCIMTFDALEFSGSKAKNWVFEKHTERYV